MNSVFKNLTQMDIVDLSSSLSLSSSPINVGKEDVINPQTEELLKHAFLKLTPNRRQDPILRLQAKDPEFIIPAEIEKEAQSLINQYGEEHAARLLGYKTEDYAYMLIAGRLFMKISLKETSTNLVSYVRTLYFRLSENVRTYILRNINHLQPILDKYEWINYRYDFSSASVITSTYLLRAEYGGLVKETPAQMFMRVAIQLYYLDGIDYVIKCFKQLARGYYSSASPTYFNAGTKKPQMASCFVMSIGDNLESILMGAYNSGMISKTTGAIGIDFSLVRHSEIDRVGSSNGIVPALRIYNDTMRYVDQGGKRKGAATISLRPHHIDIYEFVSLVDKIGDADSRCHDIAIAVWMPWIFFERVREDGDWTLFCPAKTPQLNNIYGKEFEERYIAAEKDPTIDQKYKRVVKARDLHRHIKNMRKSTGMPYIMHADTINLRSAHMHIGPIRQSNLCLEILEYTDEDNINTCILTSINLSAYCDKIYYIPPQDLNEALSRINFKRLSKITNSCVRNLNRLIDYNYYPLDKDNGEVLVRGSIHKTTMRFRSIGIGVQGLAEFFYRLDLEYMDKITAEVDKIMFACIYYNAILSSVQLSIEDGPCDVFENSPYQQGRFQFDLAMEEFRVRYGDSLTSTTGVRSIEDNYPISPSIWKQKPFCLYDKFGVCCDEVQPTWEDCKRVVKKYGMRNSLLIALMPTASTSKCMRNTEFTEYNIRNIYSMKILSGNYPVLNRYMVYDLQKLGLWSVNTRDFIVSNDGRLTGFTKWLLESRDIDQVTIERLYHLERKYITMFEIPQKEVLKRAAARGIYVDQSQSTSLYVADPQDHILTAIDMYTDELGLKTGQYYLRTKPPLNTARFTVDPELVKSIEKVNGDGHSSVSEIASKKTYVCTDDICLSCQ